MDQTNNQNPHMPLKFRYRLAIYIFIFLLMVNINPVVDFFTHPDIPYFDPEHLIVGSVAALICITIFIILEIYLNYLKKALAKISALESYLSLCANCKKIRRPDTDPFQKESWQDLESYIAQKTQTTFSHGMCPECMQKLYPHLKIVPPNQNSQP